MISDYPIKSLRKLIEVALPLDAVRNGYTDFQNIANPPFSQNYSADNMKFKDRYQFWMPTKGKADFMFVQHIISTLKSTGRMAVIMPHGVLFRGGEERKMREWMIRRGYLEAVIGLPPALFYGTGIPASILIINRAGAATRKEVLFINADHEYKEGKVQNTLRSEDIEKIAYVYRNRRYLRSSLENLWEKYHQPLHSILKERDAASVKLAGYLMELGYE
ncbi:MAG: N-6 DNA methylase [Chlorobium sp.]